MVKKQFYVIILTMFLLLINCDILDFGGNLEDPNPPAAPQFIPQTLPNDTTQSGIGPADFYKGINLEWYSNKEDDIGGYYLYRAVDSRDSLFEILDTIEVLTNIAEYNNYVDTLINYYNNYFYYLTAYDFSGNESKNSDTIRYMLTEKVDLVAPDGDINANQTAFQWYDFTHLTNEYVIELQNLETSEIIWISRFNRPSYGSQEQIVEYNFDAKGKDLQKGPIYRWRVHSVSMVDQYNRDISGAVSFWKYFTIQ